MTLAHHESNNSKSATRENDSALRSNANRTRRATRLLNDQQDRYESSSCVRELSDIGSLRTELSDNHERAFRTCSASPRPFGGGERVRLLGISRASASSPGQQALSGRELCRRGGCLFSRRAAASDGGDLVQQRARMSATDGPWREIQTERASRRLCAALVSAAETAEPERSARRSALPANSVRRGSLRCPRAVVPRAVAADSLRSRRAQRFDPSLYELRPLGRRAALDDRASDAHAARRRGSVCSRRPHLQSSVRKGRRQ